MLVHLIRHGRAVELDTNGGADAARSLTEEGADRFREAARTYARLIEKPDRLLTSPLVRARQTAELLVDALDWNGEIEESDDLVYSAPPNRALSLLQAELMAGTDSIVVVGHEPHLGIVLGALLSGAERAAAPLSKGMCVAVEVDEPQNMIGKLVFALSQKAARKLAARRA